MQRYIFSFNQKKIFAKRLFFAGNFFQIVSKGGGEVFLYSKKKVLHLRIYVFLPRCLRCEE